MINNEEHDMPQFDQNGEIIINEDIKKLNNLSEEMIKQFMKQPEMNNYLKYSVHHQSPPSSGLEAAPASHLLKTLSPKHIKLFTDKI